MQNLNINNYIINIFQSNTPQKDPIIYTHLTLKDASSVMKLCPEANFTLISIEGVDWNKNMSPWYAKKVFKSDKDFAGKADEYLNILAYEIIPEIENKLGFIPMDRGIVGYSMAGLFSIYSLYKTDIFNFAASISGSLWFDRFINYIKTNEISSKVKKIYLSLGDEEKNSKNYRIKQVEELTINAAQHFKSLGISSFYEENKGGHFTDAIERTVKGINWLVE